jgi:uncharacterized membrane protein
MIELVRTVATIVAALGSALIGGVFFAFSSFVMPALARLPAAQGIAAMQSINVTVINRWFLSAFLGTGALCGALAATALAAWSEAGARLRFGGGAMYCVGTILVTIVCNIPRNDALAAVRPDSAEGVAFWSRFVTEWTTWNHVRAAAALLGAALLVLALLRAP